MPTHFKCSIPDCKSGGPEDDRKGVIIYSLPTDEALFQKWIVQIKEIKWVYRKMLDQHFQKMLI